MIMGLGGVNHELEVRKASLGLKPKLNRNQVRVRPCSWVQTRCSRSRSRSQIQHESFHEKTFSIWTKRFKHVLRSSPSHINFKSSMNKLNQFHIQAPNWNLTSPNCWCTWSMRGTRNHDAYVLWILSKVVEGILPDSNLDAVAKQVLNSFFLCSLFLLRRSFFLIPLLI